MLRVTLLCVGRAKAGAERELARRYVERAQAAGRAIGLTFDLHEIAESRARRADDRKVEEAAALAGTLGGDARVIVLDEAGQAMDSRRFADLFGAARDAGVANLALVIGGADGLDPAFRRNAAHVVAFGAMTWPHQLVRIMACEQVYRAVTILAGHPYHRA